MNLNKKFWKNKKVFITGILIQRKLAYFNFKSIRSKNLRLPLNPISKPNFFDGLRLSKFLEKIMK